MSAGAAIRRALDLLGRASADWRNGGQSPEGSLHWPVAVNLARRELRQALDALEGAAARAGMAWWNALTPTRRRQWLEAAGSAVPADAWRAFQAGGSPP